MKKMTLEDLKPGTEIVAIEAYYSGLMGSVSHVLSGDEKETENEGDEIFVDLEKVEDMEKKYPELNGTGVEQLIMGIEDIAIILEDGTALDFEGNIHLPQDLIR
ncbi:hypothetical protein [Bacillus thuringiensis]|uniref:hypothetical protein n=1 Tax=Bacillus thuringiensis TaxID=1428 RepID=UPI0021D68DEA|nr:hypothetical protein [Bacillus thuringiensis]MCU7667247.1 hypothetical protein [Bacillus thuringiensis]